MTPFIQKSARDPKSAITSTRAHITQYVIINSIIDSFFWCKYTK